MERVHGSIRIKRRKVQAQKHPYGKYRSELREDFCYICGYCGKSESVTKNAFEIDHFIPERIAPHLADEYSNLVYACYECNRKKWGKWPSENASIQICFGKGFVDPASNEFDMHLERNEQGDIIGKTDIGRYMVDEGFEFSSRPMREIYKAMQLIKKQKQLEEKIASIPEEEAVSYIELGKMLRELQEIFFLSKE